MQAAAAGAISADALEARCSTTPSRDTLRRFEADRLRRRDRRRAAQAELRDLPGRRPDHDHAGRRHDPVRGRPHAPAAAPHGRPVPLRDVRLVVPRRAPAGRPRPQLKQAVISASALSLMYPPDGIDGLSARGRSSRTSSPRRPRRSAAASTVARSSRSTSPRRASRSSSIRRAGCSTRSSTSTTRCSRSSPTRSVRGSGVHTLPRRRPGLDPQRRRRLRGPAPDAVPHERGQLLRPARERGRPRARARDPRPTRDRRPPDLRRRHRPDRPARRDGRGGPRPGARGGAVHRPGHLGTTDDCGFSPFGDDTSTSRDTAFAKIQARIQGTAMAAIALGV